MLHFVPVVKQALRTLVCRLQGIWQLEPHERNAALAPSMTDIRAYDASPQSVAVRRKMASYKPVSAVEPWAILGSGHPPAVGRTYIRPRLHCFHRLAHPKVPPSPWALVILRRSQWPPRSPCRLPKDPVCKRKRGEGQRLPGFPMQNPIRVTTFMAPKYWRLCGVTVPKWSTNHLAQPARLERSPPNYDCTVSTRTCWCWLSERTRTSICFPSEESRYWARFPVVMVTSFVVPRTIPSRYRVQPARKTPRQYSAEAIKSWNTQSANTAMPTLALSLLRSGQKLQTGVGTA